ncbi:MAG: DUF4198 domain-containing protein [Sulfurospirillaceae bacterium]|nr:DUF4198 domain-containing protein [Sulfurospirillaceae bacterium]
MKVLFIAFGLCASLAYAHFQVILPETDIADQSMGKKGLHVKYEFTHPYEKTLMNMEKPLRAGVFADDKIIDILPSLKEVKVGNLSTWQSVFSFKEPADYIFFVEPKPYFEPSEAKYIKHMTKVVVDGMNAGEGWDKAVGLKAEIIPLSRPYGLYKGNIFSGVVTFKGKPVPNAEIEVEFYNTKKTDAPSEQHVTQVVKTDAQGVFHFAMPKAGWWGFAALLEDDESIKKDGKTYPVELGAVMWVKTYEMP